MGSHRGSFHEALRVHEILSRSGLGGHCIPIDPFYLSWKAKEYDFWTEFIELAGRISENIPYHVVNKAYRALNSVGKSISNSKILVLGLAYKRDIGDIRHSPATKIVKLLVEEKAAVAVHDPFVPEEDFLSEIGDIKVTRVESELEEAARSDLVLLVTDHSSYDYDEIARRAPLILDTRNAFKNVEESLKPKIWVL